MKKRDKSNKFNVLGKLLRPVISIIILTALVLGIALFVKEISTLSYKKIITISAPLLAKVGLSTDKAGEVAGEFIKRASDTNIGNEIKSSVKVDYNIAGTNPIENSEPIVTIAIFSDPHSDNLDLLKAISKTKDLSIDTIFHLGDHTDLGVIDKLEEAKRILDESGLKYYTIPGDHDLWQSVGSGNFVQVFGDNFHSIILKGVKFVMLDNSANYTVVNTKLMSWFSEEVKDADFVLLSQPLYHPTFNRVMGVVDGESVTKVKDQAIEILNLIRQSKVKAIIAGDQHTSSINNDIQKPTLSHIVVGAVTSERNLQTPRFSILRVYADGNYKIEDILL